MPAFPADGLILTRCSVEAKFVAHEGHTIADGAAKLQFLGQWEPASLSQMPISILRRFLDSLIRVGGFG